MNLGYFNLKFLRTAWLWFTVLGLTTGPSVLAVNLAAPVQPVSSANLQANACPVGIAVTLSLAQCQTLNYSNCSADQKQRCDGLLLAERLKAQQAAANPLPPCPVAQGSVPTVVQCQNRYLKTPGVCAAVVLTQCRTLLENEFTRAQQGMPVTAVISPAAWTTEQTLGVTEARSRPGTPDFNSYASVQRWSLESLAAGRPFSGQIETLRSSWEANGNRVDSCWEYAFESNYSVSRALDIFARSGNDPEKVYELAYVPGGVATDSLSRGETQLQVRSRNGSLRDIQGALSNKTSYSLGFNSVTSEFIGANISHRNSYQDAVYLAPVLLMFVDRAGGGVPALPAERFNSIVIHQSFLNEPDLAWHREMPRVFDTIVRHKPVKMQDGSRKLNGYLDEELNENYHDQQVFSTLLERFISKSGHSRYFFSESLVERAVPIRLRDPATRVERNQAVQSLSVSFQVSQVGQAAQGADSSVVPAYYLYEQNNYNSAAQVQQVAFNGFMSSNEPVDVELRGLLTDIVGRLVAAPSVCVVNPTGYNLCDWSKALFADRLKRVLTQADYTPSQFPLGASASTFKIKYPAAAEAEYLQCIRGLPNAFNTTTLNNPRAAAAAVRVPAFCAAGGQGVTPAGEVVPKFALPDDCSHIGGTWYQTPQFAQVDNNYTTSAERFRQGLMELEYYRNAKIVWEREQKTAKLRALDSSMIGSDGKFHLPEVTQGGAASLGDRDYAAIDYDYGFSWRLKGGSQSSACQFSPSFETHARSSVYLLGGRSDIVDFRLAIDEKSAESHGEILGEELFAAQAKGVVGSAQPINVVATGSRHRDIDVSQTILIGPVPVSLRLGVTGTVALTGSMTIVAGVPANRDACTVDKMKSSLQGAVGSRMNLEAFASAGVGVDFFGAGAEAGVRGDLTLIDVAPTAGIRSSIGLAAGDVDVANAILQVDNNYRIPFQSMNGKISAYLRISYIVDSKTWRKKLVGWDGYSCRPGWSTKLSRLPIEDLRGALEGL